MSDATPTIRRVVVHGRVQGVGYRAFVVHEALARGLEGWVRNLRDGGVEAVFGGTREMVAEMVEACRRGPPGARVDHLDQCEERAEALDQRRAGELFSVIGTV